MTARLHDFVSLRETNLHDIRQHHQEHQHACNNPNHGVGGGGGKGADAVDFGGACRLRIGIVLLCHHHHGKDDKRNKCHERDIDEAEDVKVIDGTGYAFEAGRRGKPVRFDEQIVVERHKNPYH